jgi:nucleotide-binding universal stress UspA family protein
MLVSATTLLLRNIVVGTDFSPTSAVALDYAHAIARHYSSKILLVHAISPIEESEAKARGSADALTEAELQLLTQAQRLAEIEWDTRVIKGTALEVVEQILSLDHVDLIVVGTHGAHGLRRLWVGSVAEKIFRHVNCPVLVVGPFVRPGIGWKPARILLATDLESDESKTVEYAIALAADHNAELHLLHVTLRAAAPFPEDTETFLRPYFQSRLRRLMPSWPGLEYKAEFWVEFGNDAVSETVRFIADHGMNLLVLSVHPGQPWTTHFHHEAHRMVTESPCPVLVVQRSF